MDTFGYVSVIFSVIIGLGLSHLLTGTTELFKARRRIKFYWVHLLWVALVFVGHIFLWWTMWNLRLVREWNFFTFLMLLLAPVLLYVAAAVLIPKVDGETPFNLREYFYENRAAFFSVSAAFTVLMGTENWLLTGRLSPWRVTIIFASWFVLLCASAIVKDRRWHAAIALLVSLLFLLFVFMFGLRLGGR
jgi:cell division protein FtsW (lipid II flippase)